MQAHLLPDVVGWREAVAEHTVACALAEMLVDLGVREAFGLIGGGIAPFGAALQETAIGVRHFRHEAGAAFAATEASLATNRPVAVFLTTGPGLTNALTGLIAARWDGARVIVVSAATSPAQRGRGAVQETSGYTLAIGGLFDPGAIFHFGAQIASADELEEIARRLGAGVQRPAGFVAHLSVPLSLQMTKLARRARRETIAVHPAGAPDGAVVQCAPALLGTNLWHAAEARRVRPGDLVLLFSIGSSSNATAAVMRWGDVAIAPFVEV